ncbi:MAG: sigma-70 family RNA polymerase sigma factor [Verrucomicrobiales bacterium]|nr:sigma-70 family RNA polymerase sigma factor [Verrucomicrobiales bacterium]
MNSGLGTTDFLTTRWSLVLRSRGETSEARAALSELCEAYWKPVFAYLRRRERDEDRARELTQEFFARVLGGRGLGGADPQRGRFRGFLLGAVKHFLADLRDREVALKRGGGSVPVPLEAQDVASEGTSGVGSDERVFDRAWAVNLVNRAVEALACEHAEPEKRRVFAELKPWLLGETAAGSQKETAERLGWTENALRVAVHRLRRRFRDLVRAEVAQTVEGEERVREEMRYLLEVLTVVSN